MHRGTATCQRPTSSSACSPCCPQRPEDTVCSLLLLLRANGMHGRGLCLAKCLLPRPTTLSCLWMEDAAYESLSWRTSTLCMPSLKGRAASANYRLFRMLKGQGARLDRHQRARRQVADAIVATSAPCCAATGLPMKSCLWLDSLLDS
jgi:hypothetical protein